MEGDAWVMSFKHAEDLLLSHGARRKVLSILKTIRDRQLELSGNPITSYILKSLLLYECEKHPHEHEWDEMLIGDRLIGIFLQLVSCLQCRRCPHYFVPTLDLFRGKPVACLDQAAKCAWKITRELILNSRALEAVYCTNY